MINLVLWFVVLDLINQDEDGINRKHKDILKRKVKELEYLQANYKIIKKQYEKR